MPTQDAQTYTYVVTFGFDDLAADLGKAADFEKQSREILYDHAVQVQTLAQSYVPVKTGELRASIEIRTLGAGDVVEISPDTTYEAYVEFGTGIFSEMPGAPKRPYVIEPVNANALRFMIGGDVFFAMKVVHPGMKAQPYMRPAAENVAESLVTAVGDKAVELLIGNEVAT